MSGMTLLGYMQSMTEKKRSTDPFAGPDGVSPQFLTTFGTICCSINLRQRRVEWLPICTSPLVDPPWSLGPPHLNYWDRSSAFAYIAASRNRDIRSISLTPSWRMGSRKRRCNGAGSFGSRQRDVLNFLISFRHTANKFVRFYIEEGLLYSIGMGFFFLIYKRDCCCWLLLPPSHDTRRNSKITKTKEQIN